MQLIALKPNHDGEGNVTQPYGETILLPYTKNQIGQFLKVDLSQTLFFLKGLQFFSPNNSLTRELLAIKEKNTSVLQDDFNRDKSAFGSMSPEPKLDFLKST
jgi:hypothetical protein